MVRFALVSVIAFVTSASGATIFIPPGPGTPVQDAIDAANPNDTVRLALGAYPEHVVITKALKLRGVTHIAQELADTTNFQGGCTAGPVITVAADNVQIRDLAIATDAEGGIEVVGRAKVKLKRLFVASNCAVVTRPAVNVEASTRVVVDNVWASGFSVPGGPVGIRIADTPIQGGIRLRHVVAGHYAVGVLLENNGILSVRVTAGDMNFNRRGILLQGTSRAIVAHNELIDNSISGIEIDSGSSGNSIVRNVISGSPTDVIDDGAGNCWRNNTFTTGSVPPCP